MSTAPTAGTATEGPKGRRALQLAIPAPTLLRLMWLASPALPVGGFSYSEGLESAVDAGWVSDEASAGQWLLSQMALSQARSDWPICAQAHRAWQRGDAAAVRALNAWVLHTRESAEFRLQTEQMGRSLAEWLKRSDGLTSQAAEARARLSDETPALDVAGALRGLSSLSPAPTWPVAFALAGVLCGATAEETTLACAFGWAENMAQAAIKAVPLGQSAAQRVLQRLLDALPEHLDAALRRTTEGGPNAPQQSFSPMLAILSAQHEAQYSRLFRS